MPWTARTRTALVLAAAAVMLLPVSGSAAVTDEPVADLCRGDEPPVGSGAPPPRSR